MIAGLLDLVPNAPMLRFAACVLPGLPALFDRASTGQPEEVARALCVCRGCPERLPCSQYASTLDPKELGQLGVIGGVSYAEPHKARSAAPGRDEVA
jgi:hypothetical protein